MENRMGMEIELKLALAPGHVLRLRRQPLLRSLKPRLHKLYSLYFDTPDFDLYQRGMALRLRRVGYHWIQTLKAGAQSTGALSTRPEWESQVTGNRPDLSVLPEAARALLAGLEEALQPCFETEFRRATWMLDDEQGSIELALDQGVVRAGACSQPISEVELELKRGEPARLFEVAESLLDAVPLHLEPRSKAERGYVLAGLPAPGPRKARPPAIDAHLDAAEAWRRMLTSALSQFTANVPGFLDASVDGAGPEIDTEYVHQMRVAVRRLRAVLGLGREVGLDAPDWRDDFKWLMGELSPARDWDVLVSETLPRVRAGLANPDDLAPLEIAAAAARRKANARVRAALLSRRLVSAILAAEAHLLAVRPVSTAVSEWARLALNRRYRQFRKAGRRPSEMDAAERHRLRIAGKRLRYAADGFLPLYDGKAARFQATLGQLQTVLGAANDIAVAHALLAELSHDRRQARAAGLTEGFLASEAGQRMLALQEDIAEAMRLKPFWE
jgi:inorganic triphosphatase YgiF